MVSIDYNISQEQMMTGGELRPHGRELRTSDGLPHLNLAHLHDTHQLISRHVNSVLTQTT
jgi:hypothetical protein